MKRLSALSPRAFDAGVALGVALLGGASGLGREHPGVSAASICVLTAMGLILYTRRHRPGAVLAIEAIGVLALIATGTRMDPSFPAVLVASYSAAVYGSRRLACWPPSRRNSRSWVLCGRYWSISLAAACRAGLRGH